MNSRPLPFKFFCHPWSVSCPLCWGMILGTVIVSLSVPPQATLAQPAPGLLAKKKPKPTKIPDVTLTNAEIFQEDIAGAAYITLRGQVVNQGPTVAYNTLIYYEIYAPEADTLIEAGAVRPEPYILPPGGTAEFEKVLGQGGRLKITLMQWKKQDNSLDSHSVMQFYPLPASEAPGSAPATPESPPTESPVSEPSTPESSPGESPAS